MLKFKMMRKFLAIIMMWAGLIACSDDKDVLVSIPNDVTMNELELGRFTHLIPESGSRIRMARIAVLPIRTVTTVLLPGRPLRKLWIPISIVYIPAIRMPMKFMPSLV